MPINILMPALSPTMEKGNLAKWLKKEGDKVKTGDILAEIETDKATMEYEAVDDGTLAKILVPEGTADIAVNQPIAVLATEGEDVKAAAAACASASAAAGARRAAGEPARRAAAPTRRQLRHPRVPRRSAPPRAARRRQHAGRQAAPAPAPRHQRPRRPRLCLTARPPPRQGGRHRDRPRSPARPARPHHRPRCRSGENRRRRVARAGAARRRSRRWRSAPRRRDDKIRALFEPGSYEVVPHDNMRKIIAQRLVMAKQTIPHFYLTVSCTIDKLLAAREDINATAPKGADGKPAWKLRSTTSSSRRWRWR